MLQVKIKIAKASVPIALWLKSKIYHRAVTKILGCHAHKILVGRELNISEVVFLLFPMKKAGGHADGSHGKCPATGR